MWQPRTRATSLLAERCVCVRAFVHVCACVCMCAAGWDVATSLLTDACMCTVCVCPCVHEATRLHGHTSLLAQGLLTAVQLCLFGDGCD